MAFALLEGVRYAAAFDRKGQGRTVHKRVKACRTLMDRIRASHGPLPQPNVHPLREGRQVRESQALAVANVIHTQCCACPHKQRGDCKGVLL